MTSILNSIRQGSDISILHRSLPLVAMQLLLIVGLSWYGYTHSGAEANGALSGSSAPLEVWINRLVTPLPLLSGGVIIIIALLNSFMIVRVISRNLILPERTYIPAILYFTLCYGVYYPLWELSAVVASYLLTVAVATLIYALPKSESFGKSFKAGLLIGVTPLLHPELIATLLFMPLAMVIMKRGRAESVVACAGALLPTAIWGYIVWMCGGNFSAIFVDLWRDLSSHGIGSAFQELSASQIILVSIIGLSILLSMALFFVSRMKLRTIPHRALTLIIALQVVTLAITPFSQTLTAILPTVAIPLSFTLSLLFVRRHSVVATLLYLLIMVATVVSTLSLLH